MKGDFSRDTFDKKKHYNRVLMQQGRVQLDADWNEQQAINRHQIEIEGRDIIGKCGAPNKYPDSFKIEVDNKNNVSRLKIGKGRYYVDGILCENDEDCYYDSQSDDSQPDLPDPKDPKDLLKDAHASFGLVYLDVWNRHITALDDSHIREKALGGPDSATRVKTVWQVNILPLSREIQNCDSEPDEWKILTSSRKAEMNACVLPPKDETPCYLPPQSKYYGHENQLYRVEIHRGKNRDGATFKWSRDNGSVVTAIKGISRATITVFDCGKDNVLCFSPNQWAEISDDYNELHGKPGQLVWITSVDHEKREIVFDDKITPTNNIIFRGNRHPKLRRWDHQKGDSTGLKITGGLQDLEKGINVQFFEGCYKTGDYWLIPARTATGDIEWPCDNNGNPLPQQRSGIYHHYCRLALIELKDRIFQVKADCRKKFSPLTDLQGEDEGIHIKDIRLGREDGSGEPFYNDGIVPANKFAEQWIIVEFDQNIEKTVDLYNPVDLKQPNPICFVTIYIPCFATTEIPYPHPPQDNAKLIGYQPIILSANVKTDGRIITWKLEQAQEQFMIKWLINMLKKSNMRFLLARLSLKGNFIWNDKNQNLYLDGDVFGKEENNEIHLQLPRSGDGKRGGDFEMWFWITAMEG